MTFRHLAISTAALSLVVAPVAAQAATAPIARTSAASEDGNELSGRRGITPALIIIALAAIGMAILLISDNNNDDRPVSA